MGKYISKQFSPRVYPEWGELISDLSIEKQAEILNAIVKYPNVELNSGVWRFIKSQIDKDYQEFIERAERNRETIQNYWKNRETIDNDGKQPITNDNERSTIDNDGKPITRTETRTNNDEHKRNISVATCFVEQAERLADMVAGKKNIQITKQKITAWAKSIEQLNRIEGVAIERIEKALGWYAEHIGDDYIPVIESGASFREKFTKLENAMNRNGHVEQEREDWYL